MGSARRSRWSELASKRRAEQEHEYVQLRGNVIERLTRLAESDFYIPHLNNHASLRGLWAWAITSIAGGGRWGDRRDTVRLLYAETLEQLGSLREILGRGADARGEVLRELRESRQRENEVFVVMAVSEETQAFLQRAVDPAAERAGLRPVFIAREDPEEAISEAILSGIRRSVLVIADLTFARPNCYYEAGYARGAFRRVLLTCRRDHDPGQPAIYLFVFTSMSIRTESPGGQWTLSKLRETSSWTDCKAPGVNSESRE